MWGAHGHLKLKTAALPTLLSPVCNTNIHWSFHFQLRFFPFLDFCLAACLKLPLLKGSANTLMSKLRCYDTGGNLSLGFSRDHSSFLDLSTELYSTLFENRVAEGFPYFLCRNTYGVETEVCFLFPPTPLTCWVLRREEMRDTFPSQLLLEHFSCLGGCGSAGWWCPSWWHSIPEKGKPELQSLLWGCISH